MYSSFDIIMFIIGGIFLLVWLLFFFMGKKYNALFDVLEENEYPFKEIYGLGYAMMETINYKYKSKKDRETRKLIDVLYGEKYEDYYIRVIYAQKVTLSFTVFVLGLSLYGLANDILVVAVVAAMSFAIYVYFGQQIGEKIEKRSSEIIGDFSEIVSKLALLTNAGMILTEAWKTVAYTSDREIYKEMQKTVDDINNGMSDLDAFYEFGNRCVVPEIKKFTSTIVQGLLKGNDELSIMLQQQSKEVWNTRKQNVRREGERASSKLMIPIVIMFIGILIMIIVPIFANIGA